MIVGGMVIDAADRAHIPFKFSVSQSRGQRRVYDGRRNRTLRTNRADDGRAKF
jgi:hypothetical protein